MKMNWKCRIPIVCLVFMITLTGILHIDNKSNIIVYAASESGETGEGSYADKISLHADNIYDLENTWNKDNGARIYYGTYDGGSILFRILPDSPSTQFTDEDCMLLDADKVWQVKTDDGAYVSLPFNATVSGNDLQTSGNANKWSGCDLQTYLERRYADSVNGGGWFSVSEAKAIADTKLLEQTGYNTDYGYYSDYASDGHIFVMSAKEVYVLYSDSNARMKEGANGFWWVRSANVRQPAFAGFTLSNAASLNAYFASLGLELRLPDGCVYNMNVDTGYVGFSPAINLKLSSVLFFSEATDEAFSKKVSIEEGRMETATSNTWKATVLDNSKSISIQDNERVILNKHGVVSVPYTYVNSSNDYPVNQISIVITDKDYQDQDARILYYGALESDVAAQTASKSGEFELPSDLPEGYKIYLLAEHISGNTETDYSSPLLELNLVQQCDVLFEANGGFGFMDGKTLCVGDTYILPECTYTAPDGKQFEKWDLGEVGDSITLYGDTVISAEWKAIPELAKDTEIPTEESTEDTEIPTEESSEDTEIPTGETTEDTEIPTGETAENTEITTRETTEDTEITTEVTTKSTDDTLGVTSTANQEYRKSLSTGDIIKFIFIIPLMLIMLICIMYYIYRTYRK